MVSDPGLRSRSWSRPEPTLLARAGAGADILKFRLRLPALAPGQTKLVYLIIIHIGKDQKSIFFPKSHEKSTFSFKSCENRHPQSSSQSRSRSGNFLKVRARAEKNSFGSATLIRPRGTKSCRASAHRTMTDVYIFIADACSAGSVTEQNNVLRGPILRLTTSCGVSDPVNKVLSGITPRKQLKIHIFMRIRNRIQKYFRV
jgi:hypothetical protein